MDKLLSFIKDDEGATMVEYALMITFIALVCVLSVTYLGTAVKKSFDDITGAF